jgi:hypothetical protein
MKRSGKVMSTGYGFPTWTIVSLTAIVAFLTLGIWRLFPIYPDEVFYRALVSNAFFEGFERTRVWPFCGDPGQTVSIPYVFYPAATIFAGNSFIEDLSYNRIVATSVMVASFFMLWFALKRLAFSDDKLGLPSNQTLSGARWMIFCSAVLLCSLGTLPATLVMMRGETGIYILVACLLLSFSNWRASLSWSALTAGFVVFVFTVSLFQHPKALYFLPAVALSIFALLWNHSRLMLIAALSCLAWAGAEGYRINRIQFLSCPEIPVFEEYLRSFNIDPAKIFSDPGSFVAELFQNNGLVRFLGIVRKTMFINSYDASYLPSVKDSAFVEIANGVIASCWIILILVSVCVVTWYVRQIFMQSRLYRAKALLFRRELIESVGMLALYTGAAVQICLNKTAWFYDCSYWFWILIFLAAPSLLRTLKTQLERGSFGIRSAVAGGFAFILLSSILSTVLSAQTFYTAFLSGFRGPGIPIVTMDSTATKLSIERALAECELSPTAPRLMVDDITYPFVQKTFRPIWVTYALFSAPLDAIARAEALGSPGMILSCSYVTDFPKLSFKRDGGICCTNFSQ